MILIALFSLVMIVMLPKLMDQSLPLHPLPLAPLSRQDQTNDPQWTRNLRRS